jgi:hypothetical protein
LFGPRVRFPDDDDDATKRSYATVLTMTMKHMRILASNSQNGPSFEMRRMPTKR